MTAAEQRLNGALVLGAVEGKSTAQTRCSSSSIHKVTLYGKPPAEETGYMSLPPGIIRGS